MCESSAVSQANGRFPVSFSSSLLIRLYVRGQGGSLKAKQLSQSHGRGGFLLTRDLDASFAPCRLIFAFVFLMSSGAAPHPPVVVLDGGLVSDRTRDFRTAN